MISRIYAFLAVTAHFAAAEDPDACDAAFCSQCDSLGHVDCTEAPNCEWHVDECPVFSDGLRCDAAWLSGYEGDDITYQCCPEHVQSDGYGPWCQTSDSSRKSWECVSDLAHHEDGCFWDYCDYDANQKAFKIPTSKWYCKLNPELQCPCVPCMKAAGNLDSGEMKTIEEQCHGQHCESMFEEVLAMQPDGTRPFPPCDMELTVDESGLLCNECTEYVKGLSDERRPVCWDGGYEWGYDSCDPANWPEEPTESDESAAPLTAASPVLLWLAGVAVAAGRWW